jgi:hypothetical protein
MNANNASNNSNNMSRVSSSSNSSGSSSDSSSKPKHRYFRLTDKLIKYKVSKKKNTGGYEDQENPYGHFTGAEPRLAAKKAFSAIASSYEIEHGVLKGNKNFKLVHPITFSLIETTRRKNKVKHFEGERVHKVVKKKIKMKNGKVKEIVTRYHDVVHTIKPTRKPKSDAIRMNRLSNTRAPHASNVGSSRVSRNNSSNNSSNNESIANVNANNNK